MEQSYFALVYQDDNTAWRALRSIRKLHQSGHVKLKKATVMVRQSDGQIVYKTFRDMQLINPKYGLAGFVGGMAGLLGSAPLGPGALLVGGIASAASSSVAVGYDLILQQGELPDALRRRTEAVIPAGGSALAVQIEVVNRKAVLSELASLAGATVVQHNLNTALYQQLCDVMTE